MRPIEPPDNTTWGTHFIIQGQGTDVPPGEYVFQWRLGRFGAEGFAGPVTLFGQPTPRRVIRVEARPEEPPTPRRSPDPSEKQVIGFDDFEYAGSFQVPDREGHDLPFSHSGLALRKMGDGSRRIFFNYTHPKLTLVELEIPPLVKLARKHAFVAFVNLQSGRIGYDYGGGTSAGKANVWYFYDPKDLGAAASGSKKIAIMPHSRTKVLQPWGEEPPPSLSDAITGSCFDDETKLLYVYAFLSSRGCIHAYRLKD